MAARATSEHVDEPDGRKTRRQLLAGAAGALGIVAAEVLANAAPAAAVDGDPVLAGDTVSEDRPATILSTGDGLYIYPGSGHTGLWATDDNGGGTGVQGGSNSGYGVEGNSQSGTGVAGFSNAGDGVFGNGPANGLHGRNDNQSHLGTGVLAEHTGGGIGLYAQTTGAGRAAVFGYNDGTGQGVAGQCDVGFGVLGSSHAVGVGGQTDSGTAVKGSASAAAGVGMLAENTAGGTALRATGLARFEAVTAFSRSGLVVIASGKKTVTVTPTGGLTASTLVFAVMQNVTGGVMVKAVVPSPGSGSFQIVLNKAPLAPATATVAWFVVN